MIDTNEEIPKRILDQKGTPFPPRETLGDRCKTLSRKTRVVIAAIIALIAGFAAILANLQTIKDYFRTIPSPPIVPPIVVEISNSSEVPIDVVSRAATISNRLDHAASSSQQYNHLSLFDRASRACKGPEPKETLVSLQACINTELA